ncbi:MAG TPA: Crp/Fnr family transcriptional regulator [Ectothiorhodospiraceae bacterium]|nr:Crp/Fnr family transcriptional regulator [Ectothiorhodospiraceae bacterium]
MSRCTGPASIVSEIHLLSGLQQDQREKVLASSRCFKLDAGERLFSTGDNAQKFFWLCHGQIKLTRTSADGCEKVIELVQPGKTFAEAVMFADDSSYPVNAESVEESKVIGFDGAVFKDMLRESPETCFHLLSTLSRKLHYHIDEIEQLTLSTAMTRLVAFLLQLADGSNEIHLTVSKNLLASRLSIKPETLSRLFSKLHKDGLVTVHGQSIAIHDIESLRCHVNIPQR